ncbi:MAG: VCBS repeat-containing protein [Pyrinomonadaceae bacterium]
MTLILVVQSVVINAQTNTPLDFDGDGRTDFVTARLENDQLIWYVQPSDGSSHYSFQWGIVGDVTTPEDFDGDGRTDIAIWRPNINAGFFYILESQTGTVRVLEFGLPGDDPSIVDDFDGDNIADPAVYRNNPNGGQSFFYYLGSQNNPNGNITFVPWGTSGDFPSTGDFDGDGRGDFVVQRNVNNQNIFYLLKSTEGVSIQFFGLPTDLVAPGDYDGDGRTDLCLIRSENFNLEWWISLSGDGSVSLQTFGLSNLDFPTPGDYDGDGRTDISVWRPDPEPTNCFFYGQSSNTGGVFQEEWGSGTDYPAANFKIH